MLNNEELEQRVLGLVELNSQHAKVITELVRSIGEHGKQIVELQQTITFLARRLNVKV